MPVFTYFAVTGPVLLAILIAISAYLDPAKAPSPEEFLGVGRASADASGVHPVAPEAELSEFLRLQGLPLDG